MKLVLEIPSGLEDMIPIRTNVDRASVLDYFIAACRFLHVYFLKVELLAKREHHLLTLKVVTAEGPSSVRAAVDKSLLGYWELNTK